MQEQEATAYMTRNESPPPPRDVDVTVTLDDKVVTLWQEGGGSERLLCSCGGYAAILLSFSSRFVCAFELTLTLRLRAPYT